MGYDDSVSITAKKGSAYKIVLTFGIRKDYGIDLGDSLDVDLTSHFGLDGACWVISLDVLH